MMNRKATLFLTLFIFLLFNCNIPKPLNEIILPDDYFTIEAEVINQFDQIPSYSMNYQHGLYSFQKNYIIKKNTNNDIIIEFTINSRSYSICLRKFEKEYKGYFSISNLYTDNLGHSVKNDSVITNLHKKTINELIQKSDGADVKVITKNIPKLIVDFRKNILNHEFFKDLYQQLNN